MGSFYVTPCTTDCLHMLMLYKLAKTEFLYRI